MAIQTWQPRSINQIFDSIISEKNSKSELINLNNTSKSSIFSNFYYINAVSQFVLEQIMQNHQNDINNIIARSYVGSTAWYSFIAKNFQYNYNLIIDPSYVIKYETIDESAKIIGSANCSENAANLILKIRGKNSDILNLNEYTAFQSYINKIKFAGTRILIRNTAADNLKLYLTIIYSGQYKLSDVQTAVENIINNYINNLNFDSNFYLNKLIDQLQNSIYVIDPQPNINLCQVAPPGQSYSQLPFIYSSYSGYLKIDPNFTLSETINYQSL